jgi:hypothetical protein
MRLDQRVEALRAQAIAEGRSPTAELHQGVTKARVNIVLRKLSLDHADIADAVFALLDDTRPSWFASPPAGARFCDGATTAHVACHVGILQRGTGKLDREGRDYWLKPLRDVGAIETCFLSPEQRSFIPGHPVAKSPNNCYRLEPGFVRLLQAHDDVLHLWLEDWSNADATRRRRSIQAAMESATADRVRSGHGELIEDTVRVFAPVFLPDFVPVFHDIGDGERVPQSAQDSLARAGLSIQLGDPMPDLVLWHPESDAIWIVEAVTSDGEVDNQKLAAVQAWLSRHHKTLSGATTAYPSWRVAAARQGRHKNLAPGTYMWIAEDPTRHFQSHAALSESDSR